MTTPLIKIEVKTKQYADARASLAEIVTTLNDGIEALKRQHMPALKKAVVAAAQKHEDLMNLLKENDQAFVKPRSKIFYGVKVGFKKEKGKISYSDADSVVKLIRKHYSKPDAELLIVTQETPIKAALNNLSVADLKKIGCTVTADSDEAFIKPTDSEVDKLVDALVKDAVEA